MLKDTRYLERQQFFNGQRLFAEDLQGIETLNREMRWLHNRSLHQPGIGNGFAVRGQKGDRVVKVEAGYALDADGKEIILIDTEELPVPPVASEKGEPVFYDLVVSYPNDEALDETETRQGVCAPRGVVRRREKPVFCWVRLKKTESGELVAVDDRLGTEIENGMRIVLARAQVLNCKLHRDLSLAERRNARPALGPLVVCGDYEPAPWQPLWWVDTPDLSPIIGNLITPVPEVFHTFTGNSAGTFATALFMERESRLSMSLAGPGPIILPLGLQATVPTSQACFLTTPHYTARLAGERLLTFDLIELLQNLGLLDLNTLSSELRQFVERIREDLNWALYVEGLVNIKEPQVDRFTVDLAVMVQLLEIPNTAILSELLAMNDFQTHLQKKFRETSLGQKLETCEELSDQEQEQCHKEAAALALKTLEHAFINILAPLNWHLVWIGVEG